MKVLKKGKGVRGWKKKVSCGYCRARLEVEKSDCKFVPDPRKDGDWYETKCPECGGLIIIPDR